MSAGETGSDNQYLTCKKFFPKKDFMSRFCKRVHVVSYEVAYPIRGLKVKEFLNISVSKLKGGYSISADNIKRAGKPDRYVRSFVSFSPKKADALKILEGLLK